MPLVFLGNAKGLPRSSQRRIDLDQIAVRRTKRSSRPLSSWQLFCGRWKSNEILQTSPKSGSRKRAVIEGRLSSHLHERRIWPVKVPLTASASPTILIGSLKIVCLERHIVSLERQLMRRIIPVSLSESACGLVV